MWSDLLDFISQMSHNQQEGWGILLIRRIKRGGISGPSRVFYLSRSYCKTRTAFNRNEKSKPRLFKFRHPTIIVCEHVITQHHLLRNSLAVKASALSILQSPRRLSRGCPSLRTLPGAVFKKSTLKWGATIQTWSTSNYLISRTQWKWNFGSFG